MRKLSMGKLSLFTLLLFGLIVMAGCREKPILEFSNEGIPASISTKKRTANDVRTAIIKGAAEKGWVATDSGPGMMRATIDVRGKHHAEVNIPYTTESYSINYVSSTGLKAANGKIHAQYNSWVSYLNEAIKKYLQLEQ